MVSITIQHGDEVKRICFELTDDESESDSIAFVENAVNKAVDSIKWLDQDLERYDNRMGLLMGWSEYTFTTL